MHASIHSLWNAERNKDVVIVSRVCVVEDGPETENTKG